METIGVTVTGRIGNAPRTGTTKNSKAWASFSLAADLPPRTAGGESETRWYTIWAYGPLATHVAGSLAKGNMVTVRADDITCRTWTDERDPDQRPARGVRDGRMPSRTGRAYLSERPLWASLMILTTSSGSSAMRMRSSSSWPILPSASIVSLSQPSMPLQ